MRKRARTSTIKVRFSTIIICLSLTVSMTVWSESSQDFPVSCEVSLITSHYVESSCPTRSVMCGNHMVECQIQLKVIQNALKDVSNLWQTFSVLISVPRLHILPSFPMHGPMRSKKLLEHFGATSPEFRTYSGGHPKGDPSQSLSAWLAGFLVALPVGTSLLLLPPSSHTQPQPESNMSTRLLERSECSLIQH